MKLVRKNEAREFKNSENCLAMEYPLGDKDINSTVIELKGRYPDAGRVVNTVCKEVVFVAEGEGILNVEGQEMRLKPGDVAFIEPNEKYFFEGKLTMFMPSSPAWYPEQHMKVE